MYWFRVLCSLLLLALDLIQDLQAQLSKQEIRIDDMLLTMEQLEYLNGTDLPQTAINWPDYYWPESTVVFSIGQEFSPHEVDVIRDAMLEIETVSCIRFRQTANISEPQVAIRRIGAEGCYSALGFQHKVQLLNLDTNCTEKGVVQHELLHALGFVHMQCDPRRDDYVTIKEENIIPEKKCNFKKFDARDVTDFGVPYDYSSIMHYGLKAFSKNNQPTIVPKLNTAKIGLTQLSTLDILKLNIAYC